MTMHRITLDAVQKYRGRIPVKDLDFLIVTPLEEETSAVLRRVDRAKKHGDHPSVARYLCDIKVSDRLYTSGCIVRPADSGRVEAAVATAEVLSTMWFRYIVLVGIAGAIRRGNNDEAIALGDVVVADRIIDTEFQKITDYGAVLRDREFRVNPELIHEIKFFDGRATWMGLSGRSPRSRAFDGAPRMHIGPVISGNKVMASMHEARYLSERIARSSNSGLPLAIEMEAIGVAVAAARSGYGDRFIMFRGINDFADANKAADEEIWRERACGSAADIAIEYIRSVALSHGWGKELEREA